MKTKKLLAALTLVIVLGVSSIAYAETTVSPANQGLGLGRITGGRGFDYVHSILKDKLGMTDKEITDALNSGSSMYELAEDKGMTIEEFRTEVIEEKTKTIDESVSKGTITKEQGDLLKEKVESNISSCTGNMGYMQGKYTGANGKKMGYKQKDKVNCYVNTSNN